jgi:alpha-glucosidase
MRTPLLALVVLGAVSLAWSATPTTGTLATAGASVSWSGGPMTGAFPDAANDAAGDPLPAFCGTLSTCDTFSLVVGVPSTFDTAYPTYGVQISVNWASDTNDFDVYLYDANGNLMYSSAQQLTNSEFIDAGRLAAGTYQVLVTGGARLNYESAARQFWGWH